MVANPGGLVVVSSLRLPFQLTIVARNNNWSLTLGEGHAGNNSCWLASSVIQVNEPLLGSNGAEWEQEEGPLFCMILFIGLSPDYTVWSWIETILVVLSIGMSLGI